MNDAIDPDTCTVSYTSFDAAVFWVHYYGHRALMVKADVEAAFRLLPVHPDSFRLLGCHWNGEFYVDNVCLWAVPCRVHCLSSLAPFWNGWLGMCCGSELSHTLLG